MQKFMLHYNFPPFSVGEVKFLRGPGRREIGHGVLARRALLPVLPHEDEFPYTDARGLRHPGVERLLVDGHGLRRLARPVRRRRADARRRWPGVAMGLIKGDDNFAVLTDIAGQEDHYGDMDFKVAGTREGITALQMDIKITGVTREIMERALEQAQARPAAHPRKSWRRPCRTPRGEISQLRAAALHAADPEGEDPRRHRTRWQDDPLDHRGDRLRDRDRGRRQGRSSPRPTSRRRGAPSR